MTGRNLVDQSSFDRNSFAAQADIGLCVRECNKTLERFIARLIREETPDQRGESPIDANVFQRIVRSARRLA